MPPKKKTEEPVDPEILAGQQTEPDEAEPAEVSATDDISYDADIDETPDLPEEEDSADLDVELGEGSGETVRILHGYQGKPSGGQWIAPGVYSVNDPRLAALVEYLIANGHAVRIGD